MIDKSALPGTSTAPYLSFFIILYFSFEDFVSRASSLGDHAVLNTHIRSESVLFFLKPIKYGVVDPDKCLQVLPQCVPPLLDGDTDACSSNVV